ncbi:hypothetical protein KXD96_28015 (plasmid) [Mycobacterium sp. SMC-2]|uniref:hypothetical protein n=1 Tax=Mycobacterium sp. SMC-2 TaxID=2857058 RepID=UPI0021B3CBD9|nr:hypothetical protein [Mycobacterium sp. SMC-2]UXA09677.1 hypothetical protein KXD96_28015 [Mycobacterium sp. SMC-2]
MRLAQLDLDVESWDRHPSEFAAPAKEALAEKINHALAAHGDPPADGVAAELVQLVEDFVKNYPGMLMIGGGLKEPNRKDDQLVEPYETQRAKAILGDDYEAFRRAGGNASDITITWWKMNKMLADRRAADSKSDGSAQDVAAIPAADRVGSSDLLQRPPHQGVAPGADVEPGAAGTA